MFESAEQIRGRRQAFGIPESEGAVIVEVPVQNTAGAASAGAVQTDQRIAAEDCVVRSSDRAPAAVEQVALVKIHASAHCWRHRALISPHLEVTVKNCGIVLSTERPFTVDTAQGAFRRAVPYIECVDSELVRLESGLEQHDRNEMGFFSGRARRAEDAEVLRATAAA